MNTDEGCILLSRSFKKSDIFQNEKWLKVFIWCLLKANHKPNNVPVKTGKYMTVVKVERGQFIFGRNKASKELNIKPSTVRNIIEKLEKLGNLDIKKDTHYSIIEVVEYDYYQTLENYKGQAPGQPKDNQRTTKGQPKDTNNNVKNEKNEKNIYNPLINREEFLGNMPDYIKDKWTEKQIKEKTEDLIFYCKSNGRKYKDYYSTLRNFLKKDCSKKKTEFDYL